MGNGKFGGVTFKECTSKNVHSYGYNQVAKKLYVRFKPNTGVAYCYEGVPQSVFKGLDLAESKGEYLGQFIKNQYAFTKVNV